MSCVQLEVSSATFKLHDVWYKIYCTCQWHAICNFHAISRCEVTEGLCTGAQDVLLLKLWATLSMAYCVWLHSNTFSVMCILFVWFCTGARDVLLLKLWATVFPVSDKRHPVTTPLALLTSSYLSLCPVTCLQDAATGELVCCNLTSFLSC